MNTYLDFQQLITDGQFNGYQVCFKSSTIAKDNWTAADYLEYLDNIERHEHETGISTRYEFMMDIDNYVRSVDIRIHHP